MKLFFVLLFLFFSAYVYAQQPCPQNIGFERGNFDNWASRTGLIDTFGNIVTRPGAGVRALYRNAGTIEKDKYGKFPVIAPNGSNFSVKLGSDEPDKKVDQLTYSFVVPSNAEAFSIIFNYAIVLENPNHVEHEQPRFTVKVFNISRAEYMACSSFDFVAGFNQPDFFASDVDPNIHYKPWSSATINLSAYKGESLQLEFSVNDCARGGHFGYAYFDIMEKCQNAVTGNAICPGVNDLTLQAPGGFAGYQWYTGDFSQRLSSDRSLIVSTPRIGDSFAVVLVPYSYLGCRDTAYAKITSVPEPVNLSVKAFMAGCINKGVDLTLPNVTQGSSAGLELEYFTDSGATNYLTSPKTVMTSGIYYIKGVSPSGCIQIKPVTVIVSPIPRFKVTEPPVFDHPQSANLTTLPDNRELTYTYWQDSELTKQVDDPASVSQSGIYYIKGTDTANCSLVESVQVKIRPALYVPDVFTPNGDGKNDRFIYHASGGLKEIEYFKIYNRWGLEVFSTNKPGEGWNGSYKGKILESGTFVWVLKARDWLNQIHTAKGTVILVR